jgi:hypothetical protein
MVTEAPDATGLFVVDGKVVYLGRDAAALANLGARVAFSGVHAKPPP